MMMRGFLVDENMSNLTSSASGTEASVSSSGTRAHPSSPNQTPPPPNKKKRNLPGNPDPDAEVIALSPKSLLATNRFICEICNKGFQRDQNLQLHRRGHNLPWKLKQRNKQEVVRKKVYVCPETSCVHHDPARALGDLTGIKKHFCRKHGEKKWKCEKCSKRYAVQSDWKAHSKICGTREYRCDCGTLFSRRDSFITHRAFCDALAHETARAAPITGNPFLPTHLQSVQPAPSGTTSSPTLLFSHNNNLQPQLINGNSSNLSLKRELQLEHPHHHQQFLTSLRSADAVVPPWLTSPPVAGPGLGPPPQPHINDLSSSLFPPNSDQSLFLTRENPNPNPSPSTSLNATLPPFHPTLFTASSSTSHMHSATALLQKAAQMGSMLKPSQDQSMSAPPSCGLMGTQFFANPSKEMAGSGFGHVSDHQLATFSDMMMSSIATLPCQAPTSEHGFDQAGGDQHLEDFGGLMSSGGNYREAFTPETAAEAVHIMRRGEEVNGGGSGAGNDGMTRDFLGLRAFPQRDFLDMAGLHDPRMSNNNKNSSSSSSYKQHNQETTPWQ